MRRAARRDDNHAEVRDALRRIPGVSVADTASLGGGFPDLVVGFGGDWGANVLLEVKDGKKPPSSRRLTQDERIFHDIWQGPVFVVSSAEEAVAVVEEFERRWEAEE